MWHSASFKGNHGFQTDIGSIDDDFPGMFEIYRYPVTDNRLHLSQTPVGLRGMAHEVPRLQKTVHSASTRFLTPGVITMDIPALVSSRICHDLISPIGAIGNGMELLNALGTEPSPELDLIAQSAGSARAKIQFLRIAFGIAPLNTKLKGPELETIANGMFNQRVVLDWEHEPRSEQLLHAKIILLGLLCLEKCLPYGGEINIRQTDAGVEFSARGARIKRDEKLWQVLLNNDTRHTVAPSEVQFPILANCLETAGISLTSEFLDQTVELSFSGMRQV